MYECVNSLIYLMKLHVPLRVFDRLKSSDGLVVICINDRVSEKTLAICSVIMHSLPVTLFIKIH